MNFFSKLTSSDSQIDFLGRRKIWFLISGTLMVLCLLVIPLRPAAQPCSPPLPGYFRGLNCGIEFKGGLAIEAPISTDSELADLADLDVIERAREALEGLDAGDAQIQVAEGEEGRSVLVQTSAAGEQESQERVADTVRELTGASIADSPSQRIGRKWGSEITGKAIRALVIFILVVAAFISWRFEWKMAVGALAALFHDLIITAGVYALVGFQVTPSTVIALLTILGYSLYDAVVVFDKVEEDAAAYATTGRKTYEDAANMAVNEVFMRSLNTSMTTLLPVAALLFIGAGLLGATTMKDLALALFVGIAASTYSSIFVAVPILTVLKEREPRFQNVREKVLRDARRTQNLQAAAGDTGEGATDGDGAANREAVGVGATSKGAPAARPRPSNRPRAGSKKARRRKRR